MTPDAIAVATEAVRRVRDARDDHEFRAAVRHFRHVLSAMPEETLGPVSHEGAARLEILADTVIDSIEQRIATADQMRDAQPLAEAVYQIRSLIEQVGRSQHYAAGRFA